MEKCGGRVRFPSPRCRHTKPELEALVTRFGLSPLRSIEKFNSGLHGIDLRACALGLVTVVTRNMGMCPVMSPGPKGLSMPARYRPHIRHCHLHLMGYPGDHLGDDDPSLFNGIEFRSN